MRISDWSSDVCSSDLFAISAEKAVIRGSCGRSTVPLRRNRRNRIDLAGGKAPATDPTPRRSRLLLSSTDRKSVVSGTSVSGRVDLGGRGNTQKTKIKMHH